MPAPGSEEAGADSIAPVSSLRSKFESLAKSKTAPPPPPASSAPSQQALSKSTTTLSVPAEPDRTRASLDIPRPQQWATSSSVASNATKKPGSGPDTTQTAHLPGRTPSRQRPVSMGLFALNASTPKVNVESPIDSPPNSGQYNKLVLPLQAPTSSPREADQTLRSPVNRPAPPPPSVRDKAAESPASTRRAPPPPSLPALVPKKHPPPINRLNKPTTPISLAPPNLERRDEPSGSVSPFTTPPSSDDSPSQGYSNFPSIRQRANENEPSTSRGYFPPPPTHHAVDARRNSSAPTPRPTQMQRDRQASVPNTALDKSDRPQDRPQLPARGQKEPSPSRSGRTLTQERAGEAMKRRASPRPPPPRPSEASKGHLAGNDYYPPPPRRVPASLDDSAVPPTAPKAVTTIKSSALGRSIGEPAAENSSRNSSAQGHYSDIDMPPIDPVGNPSSNYPDATRANRRPPRSRGVHQIYLNYDCRQFDICGRYCCTIGYYARVHDVTTGRAVFELGNPDREVKQTALVFKPGTSADEEGKAVWIGNSYGEISEIDIPGQRIARSKSNAHNGREVVKMYRYQNSIWSADEDGRLHVWEPDEKGVPNLGLVPQTYRVSRGHTFSMISKGYLWFASGKEIRIYNPSGGDQNFHVTMQPLHQSSAGEVTAGTFISNQLDRVYFGHSDGKVSIYSTTEYTCLGLVNVSSYKINCLAGGGDYLWAGFGTGRMYVYDTKQQPWVTRKDWQAHMSPVSALVMDKSTVWKTGQAVVASVGLDKTICLWDGWLEDDCKEIDLQDRDVEYCEFREIKTVVMTWNAGASTPGTLRAEDRNGNFFREIIQTHEPPDLLVFGFQELVDLEDKKLTAKSFFKGSKKKDPSDHDHMSRQYREWRDYLARVIEDYMPASDPYTLIHSADLVGLFSCIFVKSSQRAQIRDVQSSEVKRGLGGLHGNKGALILRFLLDDSSLCFANCHLAAGQSHTAHRNEDITAILEATSLPKQQNLDQRADHFVGGGDGSMIMDHEIAVINGDLNYRIDTMGRETVIKAIRAGQLSKLLERDQLLVSKRRNPAFRLRAFAELPINFAPTYKYDLGTDTYDTSEKSRSPAWCDRILFRGVGRVKQLQYRRHEGLRMSDHRPVTATFLMRVKRIQASKRRRVWDECEKRLVKEKQRLGADSRLDYLVTVMGVELKEAQRLVSR